MISGNIESRRGVNGDLTNGGGGSTVSITPVLESGVKIADFEIDGESGEIFAPSPVRYNLIKTNLWNYKTDNNNNIALSTGTYYLHDNINNYDMIVIELASHIGDMTPGSAWNGSAFITLYPYMLNNAYYPNRVNISTFDTRSSNYEIKDNYITKRIDNESNINGLINVWGVKLGAIV